MPSMTERWHGLGRVSTPLAKGLGEGWGHPVEGKLIPEGRCFYREGAFQVPNR